MKVPSPIYGGLHSSFHTICKNKIKSAQEIILDKLHKHSFFITIFDMVFDLHYAHLKSYVGLGVSAWLFVHLVILTFCMASNIFSSTLHTKLGLPHALDLKLTHCICGQPLNLAKTHLICCFLGGEHNTSHNVVWDAFASIMKYVGFYVNKFMSFRHLPFNIHQRIDIMLLVDDIHTLANMVIVDPT
jgi:hypothetical protein